MRRPHRESRRNSSRNRSHNPNNGNDTETPCFNKVGRGLVLQKATSLRPHAPATARESPIEFNGVSAAGLM
jgi:hypothetical protein